MALGKPFKGLFRREFRGNLDDPSERRAIFEAVCEESRKLRKASVKSADEWRRPIQQARELLAEQGRSDRELLRVAAQTITDDDHWRKELLHEALNEANMEVEDLPFLEAEAKSQLRNLRLWNRLFEEARHHKRDDLKARFRESFVLALLPLFPARTENLWYDVETEVQARSMFLNRLDEMVDVVVQESRKDDDALRVMRAAREHFPERPTLTSEMVPMLVSRNLEDPESLEVILQALLINPDDVALKRHAGRLLMQRPGHGREGFEMLVQCYDEDPEDEGTLARLVEYMIREGIVAENCLPIAEDWFTRHPEDHGAVRLLAGFYAERGDITPEAAAVYRATLRGNPDDAKLLRLLGECEAANENWAEVSGLFEKLKARETVAPESVNVGLANAWANLGRTDPQARSLYQEVVAAGSKSPVVHDRLCEILFKEDPAHSENQNQFRVSQKLDPGGYWGNVGALWIEVRKQNYARAIEKLARVLQQYPEGPEAIELAGKAVAALPRRAEIRPLLTLPPPVALQVFEAAYQTNDEALLIQTNLLRYRLLLKKKDATTAELLERVLTRDPSQQELLMKYGDLLWEEDDKGKAISLYRRFLKVLRESTRNSTTTTSFGRISAQDRARVLERVAKEIFTAPDRDPEDGQFLYEAALDPDAEPSLVTQVALAIRDDSLPNPLRVPVLERAHAMDPDSVELELILAEARALRGAPRRAAQTILKRAAVGRHDDEVTASILRFVRNLGGTRLPEEVGREAVAVAHRPRALVRDLKRALALLIAQCETPPSEARGLLEQFATDPEVGSEVAEALARIKAT